MTRYSFYLASLAVISFLTIALPKINVEHTTSNIGVPKIKVTNNTNITLACYVGIDGYKMKFILQGFKSSKWYAAANDSYDHTSFSVWCDALEFHPSYKKYVSR